MNKQSLSLIWWGLWQRRWFIFWWSISVFAFVLLVMVFYPPFRDQAAELDKTFTQQIPESARALLSDTQDFLSPIGYLSSQIYYLMLPMLLIIMAISYGSSAIGREEKEGTIELLLSRRITRSQLLFSRLFNGVVMLSLAATIAFLTTSISAHFVKLDVGTVNLLIATGACLLLALAFGAITFLVTSFGKARIASIGISTLIALGGYIIASLAQVATWLQTPSKLFPFHYYHPADILEGRADAKDMLIFLAVIVVCVFFSWFIFRRRDLAG